MSANIRKVEKLAWVLGFFAAAVAVTGCSWQGTSYDRGGNLHNGTAADWNSGNGKPDTGAAPAAQESPTK